MFGPWLLPLIGAGIGALTSKKPIQGALLGGAAGAMPGLLGAPAAAATNPALIESAVGSAGYGASSASSSGLLGGALGMLDKYGQPAATGMALANQGRQMMAANRVQPPPMMQMSPASDPIGQLLAQQAQIEEQRRKARYGIA